MSLVETAQITWDLLTCDEVNHEGTMYWYDENGDLHRENGPALITSLGGQYWLKHGIRHREDGPAVIWPDGKVEYYLNGTRYSEEEFNCPKLTING